MPQHQNNETPQHERLIEDEVLACGNVRHIAQQQLAGSLLRRTLRLLINLLKRLGRAGGR